MMHSTLFRASRNVLVVFNKRRFSSDDVGSSIAGGGSNNFFHEMFSLQGRSAIITGGGTGIGSALAMGLARAGASVVLTGRREKPLEESCMKIQQQLEKDNSNGLQLQQHNNKAVFYPSDITDLEQIPDLVYEAEYLTGIAPTILINNAGMNVRLPAPDLTSAHWQQSLQVTLTAPFMLSRALSENMKEAKFGRIISIASLQSFQAFPDSIPYAAAKTGVLGLTRSLSEAYSPSAGYEGVTCNAIAPGFVETELTKAVFDDRERTQKLAEATIVGRNSVPEDLVGAAVFLASPAASYVTGQALVVDGGFTALGLR